MKSTMKILNTKYRNTGLSHLLLFFLVIAGILHSCKEKEDDDAKKEYQNLVSYEKVSSISAQTVKLGFSILMLAYPEVAQVDFNNPFDVDIFKVKYKTTFSGNEITASGLVCIPRSSGTFPILSFQNGTNTVNANAPSMNVSNDEFRLLENLSGLGYIVVMPDYIGFGESAQLLHPYHHRESNDAAIINLIKASQEILEEKSISAGSNGKLFLLGYSQGGWATLSALKSIEEDNDTGLEPIGVSCGAGAYNLTAVATHILKQETYESPVYLPYFIESHQRNGLLNTSLDLYFNAPYVSVIPAVFNGNNNLGSINNALSDTIAKLMTPLMIDSFLTGTKLEALRNELLVNSVEAWQAKSKLLFIHGKDDKTVPAFESENIAARFKELGLPESQVQLSLLEGMDHGSGTIPWGIKSIVWLESLK